MSVISTKPTTKSSFLTELANYVGAVDNSIEGSDHNKMFEALHDLVIWKDDLGNNQIAYKDSVGAVGYLTVSEQTLLGRVTSGEVASLTRTEIQSVINILQNSKVAINNAGVLALNTTPQELVSAGGANILNIPKRLILRHNFDTAAFNTNTTLQVQVGTVVKDLTTDILTSVSTRVDIVDLDGEFQNVSANTAINLLVKSGDPAGGSGSLDVWLTYESIDIS